MQQSTKNALNRAYVSLQRIVEELYREVDKAIDNKDYADASLLEATERIFEEAEAITVVIAEQENGH